jgi:hypothetical protein
MNYPPANTTAAWYADNYPGSKMDPNCGVIHTTETKTLPGYSGGATAPTYTAVPDMKAKRLRWFAHFPDAMSARALRNDPGGVETNTANPIQVELAGTCDYNTAKNWSGEPGVDFVYWPDAPEWALEDLAEFMAWCQEVYGIPIRSPWGDDRWMAYPASYGEGNVNRLSFAQWRAFVGWCGHQHVPENDHGDPGALWWARLAVHATDQGPDPTPMTVDLSVIQEAFRSYLDDGVRQTSPDSRRHVRRLQRALNSAYPERERVPTNGLVNDATVSGWRHHELTTRGEFRPGVPDQKSIRALVTPRYTITVRK